MEDIVDTSVALAHAPLPPTSSAAHLQPPPSSPPPPHDMFASTMYYLAPSLPAGRRANVDALLREYGGEPVDVRDERLTTVIAPHGATRWEGWDVVEEREQQTRRVDVVTDMWVDRSVLLGKLQSPQHFSVEPAFIFSGIVACAATSDFSSSDLEVLAAGISALGGQWRSGLTRDVTHLFALKTGTPKYETAVHFQAETGVKILVPHWFDDSVRLGGGLPTAEYEWPEPGVLTRGVDGKKVKGGERDRDASNDSALSALTPPLPEEEQLRLNVFTSSAYTPAARARSSVEHGTLELGVAGINPYTRLSPGGTALEVPAPRTSPYPLSQPLKGKRILISRNLGLSGGRLGALHAQITRAGGTVVRFEGDDDEHESEEPAEEEDGGGGGWMVSATFRPGERGYKPLLAHPHPPSHVGHPGEETPITRILPRLPPTERARRRAELAVVAECDVLISRWRWGAAYVRAVRERRTVATLAWLFFLLLPVNAPGSSQNGTGVVESARPAPTEQLLHYPVPKGLVEGFEKHVVTVTNYTGEAREYLKKLITAMGGTFTPSMSGQNTVLIAAYVKGTKAEKARAWSIPVVNHTWLEDCFAQWRNLTVALEKYIVFPPGVDFSTLLGSRGVFVGAGKHPAPGVLTAAAAEQQEAELGRLEVEAEELLDEYDELADEWEDEQRVEKHRNADGLEEWVAVFPHVPSVAEEEEESQLAQPGGTEAEEMKEVVDDLIEVQDDDDVVMEVQQHTSPERQHRSLTPSTPVPVKPKAKGSAKSKPSPPRTGTSRTTKTGKEKEPNKGKTRATVVNMDVLDFSSSDSEPEVKVAKPVKKGPPTSAKKPPAQERGTKAFVSEEVEEAHDAEKHSQIEDSDMDIVPRKKQPPKSKPTSPTKPVSKAKKKAVVSSDEEDDVDGHAQRRAQDDEEAMEVDLPKAQPKKDTSNAAKRSAPSKSKPPLVNKETDDESMEEDGPVLAPPTANGKLKSTAVPSKKVSEKADKAPLFPSSSLLARPKADARTRVVRRTPKEPAPEAGTDGAESKSKKRKKVLLEESNDSDEIIVSKSKGKGKESAAAKAVEAKKSAAKDAKKPAPKAKGRARIINTPESEDESEEEEEEEAGKKSALVDESESEPAPPRRNLVRRVTAERPTTTSKPVSKSAATHPVKDAYEDEKEDSDDSLPEVSHIFSKPEKHTTVTSSKPKSKGKAKDPANKMKPSAPKKKKPVETDTDEHSEPNVITVKAKPNPTAKTTKATTTTQNAVAGPSTPRRTMSVLLPSLNLSGKPKSSAAKETSKLGPVSTAKKLVSEEPENEQQDEDEVTHLISPKLTRTSSLRVASGHVSTPSSSVVVKKSDKQEKSRSKRTADEALSSGEEDARRMPPPQASTSTHTGPLPRRTAAAKASERLHNQIMPDVIAYESQKRRAAEQARKGRVSMDAFKVAGEGSLEELRVHPNSSQSQSRTGKRASQSDGEEDKEEEKKPIKKKRRVSDDVEVVMVRRGKAKPETPVDVDKEVSGKQSIQIMTTQVTLSDDVLRALLKLGIKMTSRAGECTHLIAKQVVRTEKFLCALTRAPWVVTEAWALNCVAEKRALPEKDYLLKDKAGEDKYGVRLVDALRRAEQLKGSLFKGHTFYVTGRVPVDSKLLKNVVNACGGQVSTQTPSVRTINTAPDKRHVISCADDISIWRPLANAGIKVYTQELLLNGALRQQVDYDSREFLVKA